jgi:predicted metal-dependent hydrolase
MSTLNTPRKDEKPIIAGCWMAGGDNKAEHKTVILAIPKQIAIQYDIYKRTSVLITPMDNGFFVKRLQVLEQ